MTERFARNTLAELPIEQIRPSALNPRRTFEAEALQELADSIKEHGLIEPIAVRPAGESAYEIIAGERRWRASKLAGLETIVATIHDVDDATALQLAIIENLHRKDLDPVEEAEGFQALISRGNMTQDDVAAAVNRSREYVANALRLLKLPDVVRDHLREGRLTAAHGRALVKYAPWPKLAEKIAALSISEGYTSKVLEKGIGHNGGISPWPLRGLLADVDRDIDTAALKAAGITVWGESAWDRVTPDVDRYAAVVANIRKAQQAEQQREMQKLRDQAKAEGKPIIKLEKLDYRTYERLDSTLAPKACGPSCPCYTQAMGHGGEGVVSICTDPARFNKLKTAETRDAGKERKAAARSRAEELDRLLAAAPAADVYGLAVVAAERIWQARKKVGQRLIRDHCAGVLDPSVLDSYETRRGGYPQLAQLPIENLLRIIVQSYLLNDMQDHIEYGAMSASLGWYMEQAAASPLPTDPRELQTRLREARKMARETTNQPKVSSMWQATAQMIEERLAGLAAGKSAPAPVEDLEQATRIETPQETLHRILRHHGVLTADEHASDEGLIEFAQDLLENGDEDGVAPYRADAQAIRAALAAIGAPALKEAV